MGLMSCSVSSTIMVYNRTQSTNTAGNNWFGSHLIYYDHDLISGSAYALQNKLKGRIKRQINFPERISQGIEFFIGRWEKAQLL